MMKSSKLFIIAFLISNSICGMELSDYLSYECSSFENDKYYLCYYLNSGEENKQCTLVNNKCVSSYKSCEDYKENVNQNICESIIPDDDHKFYPKYKCIFKDNKCISKERECSDFKVGLESPDNCLQLKSKDEKKRCYFQNNKCEEHYKECEDYKENVQKKICEFNQPENALYEKCSFEEGKCITKDRLCNDFILGDESICESLIPSDESKRCAWVNNKCIEQYKKCEDYKGNNQKECESIEPFNQEDEYIEYNNKCILEKGKCIKKEKTSCEEYQSGTSEYNCYKIVLKDQLKICVLFNNSCVETFKTCEDYKGDDIEQNVCESIITTYYKDEFYYLDYKTKCVYEDNKCTTKQKNCSEFKLIKELGSKGNIQLCEFLITNDKNKKCIFYIDGCIESYSNCEDYNQNVQKEICESIITEDYLTNKCVFDENKNECITEVKPCSSYQTESFKLDCELLGGLKHPPKNPIFSIFTFLYQI